MSALLEAAELFLAQEDDKDPRQDGRGHDHVARSMRTLSRNDMEDDDDEYELDLRRYSGSEHGRGKRRSMKNREVHNQLEKNRRAHLKQCFEDLKEAIPDIERTKQSTVSVLQHATTYIGELNVRNMQQTAELLHLRQMNEWCRLRLRSIEAQGGAPAVLDGLTDDDAVAHANALRASAVASGQPQGRSAESSREGGGGGGGGGTPHSPQSLSGGSEVDVDGSDSAAGETGQSRRPLRGLVSAPKPALFSGQLGTPSSRTSSEERRAAVTPSPETFPLKYRLLRAAGGNSD